ncbi:hypothetical protein C0991_007920, partial [Blastosporella zonata]
MILHEAASTDGTDQALKVPHPHVALDSLESLPIEPVIIAPAPSADGSGQTPKVPVPDPGSDILESSHPGPIIIAPALISTNGSAHQHELDLTNSESIPEEHIEIPRPDESNPSSLIEEAAPLEALDVVGDSSHEDDSAQQAEGRPDDALINGHATSNDAESKGMERGLSAPPTILIPDTEPPFPSEPKPESENRSTSPAPLSIAVPAPISLPLDMPKAPSHPLITELAQTKHRYDSFQRSLRDCHLALE